MKTVKVVCSLACVGFCTVAYAGTIVLSEGVIAWDTLSISTDPGMTFTWKGFADPAKETAIYGLVRPDAIISQISGWNALSDGIVVGNLKGWGTADDHALVGSSSISQPGDKFMELYGGASRWGVFEVQGSGTMTVSVDYSLSYSVDIHSQPPGSWVTTWAQANLELGEFIPSPIGGGGLWVPPYSEDLLRLTSLVSGSQDAVSESRSGTLTVQYYFSEGDIGRLDVGGHGKLWASPSNVPDAASTLMLLGASMVGIAIGSQKQKHSRCN